MKPQNFEEKIVWYYIIGTYGWYLLGLQYTLVPVIAWSLTIYLGKKLWNQPENTPTEEKITIPFAVWVWAVSMLIMEVALIVSHIDFDLGLGKIVSSSILFATQWALFVLFPLIGSCLNIRPQLFYRAACILCLQSLVFIAICYLAMALHLPASLYTSPFRFIARDSTNFYSVSLYDLEPTFGGAEASRPRLELFTPWPPALGLVANIYFFLTYQESNKKWRLIGMVGAIAMILVSLSRLSMLCLPAVLLLVWIFTNFSKPITQITAGILSFFAGIFATAIVTFIETFRNKFDQARPASSKVRSTLGEIALDRWWQEAPLWGHGLNEPGAKLVEGMPIGSHHTWFGLLFMKGLVGLIALVFPFLWTFLELLSKVKNSVGRVSLSILLILFFFCFAENIDVLAYLYWPGLVMIGIAFKETVLPRRNYP